MAKLDAFTAQIVKLVRNMPDEAILDLVRNQLGLVGMMDVGAPVVAARATVPAKRTTAKRGAAKKVAKKAAPKKVAKKAAKKVAKKAAPKKVAKKAAKKGKAPSRTSEQRQKALDAVEKVVKGAKGLSVSELVKRTGLPASRVSSAVRELKGAKRIFQGGDRRFARYAGDPRTAQQASETARKTAPGPIRKDKPAKKAKAKRKTKAKRK